MTQLRHLRPTRSSQAPLRPSAGWGASRASRAGLWLRGLLYGSIVAAIALTSGARADEPARPPITALAFTPDGKMLLVGSQAGLTSAHWPSLKPASPPGDPRLDHIHDLRFAPTGTALAIAGGSPRDSGEVVLWKWPKNGSASEAVERRVAVGNDVAYAVAWSQDSKRLASVSEQHVAVIDRSSGKLHQLQGHSKTVLAVSFLGDGKHLLTAGRDRSLRLWNLETRKLRRTLENHTRDVRAVALRPGESVRPMIASAGADRTVRLWQPTIGRLVRFARLPSAPLAIAWTADGRWIVAACQDGAVRVIDPDTVEIRATRPGVRSWAYSLAVAPDGKSVAVGGPEGELRRVGLEVE